MATVGQAEASRGSGERNTPAGTAGTDAAAGGSRRRRGQQQQQQPVAKRQRQRQDASVSALPMSAGALFSSHNFCLHCSEQGSRFNCILFCIHSSEWTMLVLTAGVALLCSGGAAAHGRPAAGRSGVRCAAGAAV